MRLDLIGFGMDSVDYLTTDAHDALMQADCILGAPRLLSLLGPEYTAPRRQAVSTEMLCHELKSLASKRAALVFSGDVGFYSGATALRSALPDADFHSHPGISCVQYFAAALNRPWQGWKLISAHGADVDAARLTAIHKELFFLTDAQHSPAILCQQLCEADFGDSLAFVGERLGSPEERILRGTAAQIAKESIHPLSVLLICRQKKTCRLFMPGLPDEQFLRLPEIPMTKQEVRAVLLSRLAPQSGEVLWDVGCGSGSVAVELALAAPDSRVYGIDCKQEACALTKENAARFGLCNLTVNQGLAPDALNDLPAPDGVFIGGSEGKLKEILTLILQKNPTARVVITAVTVETLCSAWTLMNDFELAPQLTQLSVSHAQTFGSFHLMQAQNPIFILSGGKA